MNITPIGLTGFTAALLIVAGCRSETTVPDTTPKRSASEATAVEAGWTTYGEEGAFDPSQGEPVSLASVVADPAAYEGRTLNISGEVSEVCTAKGCWLKLADEGAAEPVFVKFTCPVEGRLIPTEAVGREAVVTGQVIVEEMSEADARHIAEESGKPAAEVEQIEGPQQVIRIMSPTAKVRV